MRPTESPAEIHDSAVLSLVQWMDKPETLSPQQLDDCIRALLVESLQQNVSIGAEAVQLRDEMSAIERENVTSRTRGGLRLVK